MPPLPRTKKRHIRLLCGGAAVAWTFIVAGAAWGQPTALSLPPSPVVTQGGGLDMDVDPAAPLAATPAVRATLPDTVRDSIASDSTEAGPSRSPSLATLSPDHGQSPDGGMPPLATPEPVSLDRPTVIDTATFQAGSTTVALFGIEGVKGEIAQGLQGFLTSHGNRITCQAQASADFVCLQPDGTDVAEVALVNGAARAKGDAPDSYRNQEVAAQTARRGIWANLPPPPVTVKHPEVRDTAILVAEGQAYVLDGLQGLGAPFAGQLQAYIVQHGDSLTCDPQGLPGHYICLLGDSTDIAKVALVNGAARVAPDAPDSYRVQQAEALNNHRGFWLNQSPEVLLASTTTVMQPAECCALVPGDDGIDGIVYVGGVPTAVIEGETVFITYIGDGGWGYYDHWHHWRGVPGRYRAHLEHYHPYGHGLRGYGRNEALRREAAFRPAGVPPGPGMHSGMAGPPGMHPGMIGPGGAPPAMAAGMHPGMAGAPGMHPGMGGPGASPGMAGMHPGIAGPRAPGGIAGPRAPGGMAGAGTMHPGSPGGGFIHPGPSAAGFHPGGGAPMPHGAPPPAMHASAPGGGGKKH